MSCGPAPTKVRGTTPPDRLAPTLAFVARAAASAADPWWLIGSAALVVHGVDPGPVGDVDLLMSARDSAALLTAQGLTPRPGEPDDRFRSAVFGRWTTAGIPVELMGGFETKQAGGDGGWRPVLPATCERIGIAGTQLFVPSRAEVAALLHRLGRPKDLARAALLDQAIPRSAGPNACGSSADSG